MRQQDFWVAGEMAAARVGHTTTLLVDGGVRVAGGKNTGGPPNSAEFFDPTARTWRAVGLMTSPRRGQITTAISNVNSDKYPGANTANFIVRKIASGA